MRKIYLSKEQAIARLRKFIYYKMKKRELSHEEARHVDDNKAMLADKELAHV
jgi:hypothetical protein